MEVPTTEEKSYQELANFDNILWKAYKAEFSSDKTIILNLNDIVWPVKKYISCKGIHARGRIKVISIFDGIYLVIAEVISKSINIRGMFRYLLLVHNNIILVEEAGIEGDKLFMDYIVPTFQLTNVSEIRINAMRIRKLAKNNSETPTKLTLLVNNQTAGVDGLETLTLTGENIIRGIQTLKDRQEVDLKAESIGPWIEIETHSIKFEMGKGFKIKKVTPKSFNLIAEAVN